MCGLVRVEVVGVFVKVPEGVFGSGGEVVSLLIDSML